MKSIVLLLLLVYLIVVSSKHYPEEKGDEIVVSRGSLDREGLCADAESICNEMYACSNIMNVDNNGIPICTLYGYDRANRLGNVDDDSDDEN